ncbi:MAG TPA: hypothetical protein VE710_14880 [Candidatus Bathyarchaeia archaeon]|nr:hypothetical protein [Candidatus Bathyarchaeia archaeon]
MTSWKKCFKLPLIFFLSIMKTNVSAFAQENVVQANGTGSASITTSTADYSFPAEWEEQSAVWLAWYETREGMHNVTAQIIEKLQNVAHVKVELIIRPYEKDQVIQFLQNYNIDTEAIGFHEYNNLYIYTRT